MPTTTTADETSNYRLHNSTWDAMRQEKADFTEAARSGNFAEYARGRTFLPIDNLMTHTKPFGEFTCPSCGGLLFPISGAPVMDSLPPVYSCKCRSCGREQPVWDELPQPGTPEWRGIQRTLDGESDTAQ